MVCKKINENRSIILVGDDDSFLSLCRTWLDNEFKLKGATANISEISSKDLINRVSQGNRSLYVINCWSNQGTYDETQILDCVRKIKSIEKNAEIYLLGCEDDSVGTKAIREGVMGYSLFPYKFHEKIGSLVKRLMSEESF